MKRENIKMTGATLLFADDEAFSRIYPWEDFLIEPLKDLGIEVIPEDNPSKVLERLHDVDAVILDMTWYGKILGPELFRKIKEIRDIPVIIMSSVFPPDGVGDDYIMKGTFRDLPTRIMDSLKEFGIM
jgi:hypothetical protein